VVIIVDPTCQRNLKNLLYFEQTSNRAIVFESSLSLLIESRKIISNVNYAEFILWFLIASLIALVISSCMTGKSLIQKLSNLSKPGYFQLCTCLITLIISSTVKSVHGSGVRYSWVFFSYLIQVYLWLWVIASLRTLLQQILCYSRTVFQPFMVTDAASSYFKQFLFDLICSTGSVYCNWLFLYSLFSVAGVWSSYCWKGLRFCHMELWLFHSFHWHLPESAQVQSQKVFPI
jgi:hypothetical protein